MLPWAMTVATGWGLLLPWDSSRYFPNGENATLGDLCLGQRRGGTAARCSSSGTCPTTVIPRT